MSFLYIIAALLMFGIMITVHEAGHFFAARLNGIPVREFAIGFGLKLASWKSKKHETQFAIRAIPLGGYCAFYGEDDGSEEAKEDPRYFGNFSAWRRLTTILAGPLMNLLMAFVVAVGFYALSGIPTITGPAVTSVQSVNANSPAEYAGLKPFDIVREINGVEIRDNVTEAIDAATKEGAVPMEMVVERAGKEELLTVTPMYSDEAGRYMIGVNLLTNTPQTWKQGTLSETINAAYQMSVQAGASIFQAIGNLFFRGEGFRDMAGIVGVTQTIVQTTQESQLQGYLFLMCLISINLGLFNLLPIPGLDGSRILFLLVEAIRGKPFKREGYVHAIGMLLLFALMIWINIRDILRLF